MKSLIVLILFTTSTVFAQNCKVSVSYSPFFERNPSKSVEKTIKSKLEEKGYSVSTDEDAEYKLVIQHGWETGEDYCREFGAHVSLFNSGLQQVAEGSMDGFSLRAELRSLILGHRNHVRNATKGAIKQMARNLPTCAF